MYILKLSLVFVLPALFFGCASTPERGSPEELYQAVQEQKEAEESKQAAVSEAFVREKPDWWDNPKRSGLAVYGKGQARKSSPTLAAIGAEFQAQQALAAIFGTIIEGFRNQYLEEIDDSLTDEFAAGAFAVFKNNLKGYSVLETHTVAIEGKVQVYTLLEYPIAEANKFLVNQLKKDPSVYSDARKSENFRRMEELLNKQ